MKFIIGYIARSGINHFNTGYSRMRSFHEKRSQCSKHACAQIQSTFEIKTLTNHLNLKI